jgi:hypothetical protein
MELFSVKLAVTVLIGHQPRYQRFAFVVRGQGVQVGAKWIQLVHFIQLEQSNLPVSESQCH